MPGTASVALRRRPAELRLDSGRDRARHATAGLQRGRALLRRRAAGEARRSSASRSPRRRRPPGVEGADRELALPRHRDPVRGAAAGRRGDDRARPERGRGRAPAPAGAGARPAQRGRPSTRTSCARRPEPREEQDKRAADATDTGGSEMSEQDIDRFDRQLQATSSRRRRSGRRGAGALGHRASPASSPPAAAAAIGGSTGKRARKRRSPRARSPRTLNVLELAALHRRRQGKSHPTLDKFQKKYGAHVKYIEEINDNIEFFGKVRQQLRRRAARAAATCTW